MCNSEKPPNSNNPKPTCRSGSDCSQCSARITRLTDLLSAKDATPNRPATITQEVRS